MVENSCINCGEHCCIGPVGTFITLRDAERIANFTGIRMNKFCIFAEISKDKEWQKELMKDRDHSYFEISGSGKVLQLKAKDNEECIFLKDRKCSIHEVKPLVCRIFPIGYKSDGSLCYFGEDSYCRFMDKDIKKTCKRIGFTISQIKKLVKQHLKELEEYKEYEKYFIEGKSVEEVWGIIKKK